MDPPPPGRREISLDMGLSLIQRALKVFMASPFSKDLRYLILILWETLWDRPWVRLDLNSAVDLTRYVTLGKSFNVSEL